MNQIKLYPYSKNFLNQFEKEKARLAKTLSNVEIHHIGSTAIPGTNGKGIIDVLVGLKDWNKNKKDTVKMLKELGFTHIHPEENGRIFLSKVAKTKCGDVHIHLTDIGSKNYEEMLKFRNILRSNPKLIVEYNKLKKDLLEKTKGKREEYTKQKDRFIKNVLKTS